MEDHLYLYTVEKAKDDYHHVDTTRISLHDKTLKDALSNLQIKRTNNIYLSLPLSLLSLRELKFPFSERKKIDETIRFEIEGKLLGNVTDYIIDHTITGISGDDCTVLAVCIEKKRLKEIIDTFSDAGIEPEVITSLDLHQIDSFLQSKPVIEEERRIEIVLNEIRKPTINLRKEEFQYSGDVEGLKKTFRLALIFLTVLFFIYGTDNLAVYKRVSEKNGLLMKEIKEIYLETFPEEKKVIDPLRQFKGKANQLIKKKEIFGSTSSLDILMEVTKLINRAVRLNELKYEDNTIIIKGDAKRFEDVEIIKNRLSSQYDDVRVINSTSSADGKINFTITMKERE